MGKKSLWDLHPTDTPDARQRPSLIPGHTEQGKNRCSQKQLSSWSLAVHSYSDAFSILVGFFCVVRPFPECDLILNFQDLRIRDKTSMKKKILAKITFLKIAA